MFVRRPRRAVLAGLAVAAVLGGTTAAFAADGTSSSAPAHPRAAAAAPTGDGARALCRRAPKMDRRLDRALKRLDAGAGRRGSLDRLQQRVDNARKAGHDEIATFLQDRLDFRKSLVPTLEKRQKDLAAVRQWCQNNDDGAGSR
jgi:hypothetical protein